MANQSVRCPSCGSAECQEYRADAFVCANCNSTFRWVNPTQVTIHHQGSTCACGKLARAVCTQCQTPLCNSHQASWRGILVNWMELKKVFARANPELLPQLRRQGGMANCSTNRSRGWLNESGICDFLAKECRRKERGHPLPDEVVKPAFKVAKLACPSPDDVLCISCIESLFLTLLRPVESWILKLEAAGKFCAFCLADRPNDLYCFAPTVSMATEHCCCCGATVCFTHCERCKQCGKAWCKPHWTGQEEGTCSGCAPKGFLRRLFG